MNKRFRIRIVITHDTELDLLFWYWKLITNVILLRLDEAIKNVQKEKAQ